MAVAMERRERGVCGQVTWPGRGWRGFRFSALQTSPRRWLRCDGRLLYLRTLVAMTARWAVASAGAAFRLLGGVTCIISRLHPVLLPFPVPEERRAFFALRFGYHLCLAALGWLERRSFCWSTLACGLGTGGAYATDFGLFI